MRRHPLISSVKVDQVGNPTNSSEAFSLSLTCECGKNIELHSVDNGHPAYCSHCELAYYLRFHDNHYHVRSEHMSRQEILQENYGQLTHA